MVTEIELSAGAQAVAQEEDDQSRTRNGGLQCPPHRSLYWSPARTGVRLDSSLSRKWDVRRSTGLAEYHGHSGMAGLPESTHYKWGMALTPVGGEG